MTTDTQELVAPVIDEPATSATVENAVRLKGTGVPDAIVQVTDLERDVLILEVRVWSNGTWSGNAVGNLEGRRVISAVQTHNYATSPASGTRSFVVK